VLRPVYVHSALLANGGLRQRHESSHCGMRQHGPACTAIWHWFPGRRSAFEELVATGDGAIRRSKVNADGTLAHLPS
jgi:hypothetical protein